MTANFLSPKHERSVTVQFDPKKMGDTLNDFTKKLQAQNHSTKLLIRCSHANKLNGLAEYTFSGPQEMLEKDKLTKLLEKTIVQFDPNSNLSKKKVQICISQFFGMMEAGEQPAFAQATGRLL